MAQAIPALDLLAPPDDEHPVHLHLTHREAVHLAVLCARIGGHPDTTPRGYFQNISTALHQAGVSWAAVEDQVDGPFPGHYFRGNPAAWSPFVDQLEALVEASEVDDVDRMRETAKYILRSM